MNADTELTLRETSLDELEAIAATEHGEASASVLPASPDQHREDFSRPDTLYRTIVVGGEPAGFLILNLDADGLSLEMRRIVVTQPGHGHGTRAVQLVDELARRLGRERIWLDVFEDNARARHVYEGCGYSVFGDTELDGRRLLLYERLLEPQA